MTGGRDWTQISPDLARASWDVPASVGVYRDRPNARASQRGVIYMIGPSYVDINAIWVGTDDGLIHVTRSGGEGVEGCHAAGSEAGLLSNLQGADTRPTTATEAAVAAALARVAEIVMQ